MLHGTIPLGRIAGIRIGVHWSMLITVALFAWVLRTELPAHDNPATVWAASVGGAVALLACLAAHELAHSVVARQRGVHVDRIVLWLLGGVSELTDEPDDAGTELRVALAGPLTSLTIGLLWYAAAVVTASVPPHGLLVDVFVWLAIMNIALAVFNLLPGAPLDGGRVVRALIWRHTGDRLRAATTAARCGQVLGMILILLGALELIAARQPAGLWLILLGWFLRTSANTEMSVAGLRHRLGDTRIRDVMTSPAVALPVHWSVDDLLHSPAADSGHSVFPLIDDAGHPIALLAWSDLSRTSPAARATAQLSALARRLPPAAVVHEDDVLADAATRVLLRPALDALAVVDAVGRLTGIVTATDLVTACNRSTLGLAVRPPAPHDPFPGRQF
jgi:Zn-dependent protease/CBS domain-containing protein